MSNAKNEEVDFKESLLSGYVESAKATNTAGPAYNNSLASIVDSTQPLGTIENEKDLNENLERIERRALSVIYTTEGSSKTDDLRDTIEVVHKVVPSKNLQKIYQSQLIDSGTPGEKSLLEEAIHGHKQQSYEEVPL